MLSLYEILKASKTGIAPDMWTALAGANFGGAGSGAEVKELTGIPPLSFTANGQPLLDYLISGNMSQTGTPTQQNPIQPQETGERTGNLCPITSFDKTTDVYYSVLFDTPIPAGTYTISAEITATSTESRISFRKADMSQIIASNMIIQTGRSQLTVTLNEPCYGMYIYGGTTVFDNIPIKYESIMLNTGSTALPYEPYGYKLDISSANTTAPIYLGEVETTRKIKKLVFDGTEGWNKGNYPPSGGYQFFTPKPSDIADNPDWLTTHFKKGCRLNGSAFASYLSLYPEKSILPENATANDFKSWLAQQYANGTPVTVWYVLSTPTTGIVNEPIRKIGNYADTVSMEQAGVSIPTLNGLTVVDVDTTLKPSEMYIKYKG